MNSKIVAFAGIESYDLVHYLTKVATVLEKRCLVIDRTDNHTMMETLNCISTSGLTERQGVDYTTRSVSLKMCKEYDYVFIYYGLTNIKIPKSVEEVYLVTDCQKQNVKALTGVALNESQFRSLLLRGASDLKSYSAYVTAELSHLGFSEEDVIVMPFSSSDLDCQLSLQYDSVTKFDSVSYAVKEFITQFFSVDFNEKDIQKAFKTASRNKEGVA